MSKNTPIQWCDGTVNPVMGCGGCELYPKPAEILAAIDRRMIQEGVASWKLGRARSLFTELVEIAWKRLLDLIEKPGPGHINAVTTTNIYHLRKRFAARVTEQYGTTAGSSGLGVITNSLKCYAAKLHLNKSYSIENPTRNPNKGYASTFEQVKTFSGRLQAAAAWSDLLGTDRCNEPWLKDLPRLIFVSDMGDALSRVRDFDFLQREIEDTQAESGRRHLWLWLSKRPQLMKRFADKIGGMPNNFCAMTTVTSDETLHRVDSLREVDASVRGLSLEPLWTGVADQLDLTGIDWVICGGESGAKNAVTPFPIEWATDLRALCQEQGVAFFLKQLGRRPSQDGLELSLADSHGGDWNEWDAQLRTREFPTYFHNYRQEKVLSAANTGRV
ncbi:DUF5131 family protein [Lignipirellula cremea]|uniref:Phage protein Gp37/Gp68 n=1 Tax=Lignipirellula cremea TaxID=2528010 RepID=A0A518DWQ3_9BACT|nr:DUF5131 family protein [Lignipirellula cremea]QDU96269.1 Phage protein Gp37/Gp68 [Lignipirellula cremea]